MIYVVTNRSLVEKGNLFEAVERAVENGANAIILREKDLNFDSLLSIGESMKVITDKYNIPLVINGNIEVAKSINAYGVQLSYVELNNIKDLGNLKLGISIHCLEEAINAERHGAHYIIAGNIFETSCKPGLRGKGLDFIKEISRNISIPVIAIGGISTSNAKEVMIAGASGVAIMSSAMTDYDGSFMRKLKEVF